MTLRLKANRRFPSIPVVTDDPKNHTQVLMAIKEAMEIGQRRTTDLLNSYIRVQDLVDLGLITIEGNTNSIVGADLSQIANIGDLSGAAAGDFLRFDGTEWTNDQLGLTDITQGMVTQHQAALVIDWSQIANEPSEFPPEAHTHPWSDLTSVPALLDDIGALSDPGSDQLLFWDDSAGEIKFLQLGTNLSITDTTLNATGGGVSTVNSGTGISVNNTDPENPIINLSSSSIASLALADSAMQPGDNVSDLTNDAGYLIASDLAAVALSGDYDDLINTPTIPPDISSATFITADDETATLANSLKLVAGSNVTFDTSTPGELKISASGGGGGGTVESVIGTTNEIDVDSSDPANPVVSLANAVKASLALADSAVQPGDLAAVAFSGDYADLSNRPAIPTPADPTAQVGLTAVNGSASTFMRSDAAPALDQGISPTWTGEHIFTMPTTFIDDVSISGDNLELQLGESADLRLYHDGTDSFVRSDTGLLRLNLGSTSALALSASAAEFRVRPYINLDSVSSVPAQAIASDADFLIAAANAHMSIELIAANGGTNGIRCISASGGFDSLEAIKTSTNQYLGYLGVGGYDGTAWAVPSAGLIGLSPAADWSSTSHPTLIVFETTAINSTTRNVRVRINHDGTMQITDGSASFPGLSFLQDNDTGLTRLGSNHLALVTGGTARLVLKPGGQVRLIPLSSDPPGAENGDIYYNSSMNKFRGYAGGSWVNLH